MVLIVLFVFVFIVLFVFVLVFVLVLASDAVEAEYKSENHIKAANVANIDMGMIGKGVGMGEDKEGHFNFDEKTLRQTT